MGVIFETYFSEIIAPVQVTAEHEVGYVDMDCSQDNVDAHASVLAANMQSLDCVRDGVCTWELKSTSCEDESLGRRKRDTTLFAFLVDISLAEDRLPGGDVTSK